MKFHEYPTLFHELRSEPAWRAIGNLSAADWYIKVRSGPGRDWGVHLRERSRSEANWYLEKRPYYSVWPVITKSLLSVKLDLDSGLISLPVSPLLVRFAVGSEFRPEGCSDDRKVRSILSVQR